jgi:hypothetical protein
LQCTFALLEDSEFFSASILFAQPLPNLLDLPCQTTLKLFFLIFMVRCYMVCTKAVVSSTVVTQLIILSYELVDYLETSETEGYIGAS